MKKHCSTIRRISSSSKTATSGAINENKSAALTGCGRQSNSKLETSAHPEHMEKLLIRMVNSGVDDYWCDAIVTVLDGGKAPELLDDDLQAVAQHRKWMRRRDA
jgi:hypothetical protein